jgi:hypothetical protein
MACSGCNGPIFLVLSLGGGREEHCEHGGALMAVISNASTRAVVIDSMGRGRHKQPIQASEPGQYRRRRRGARLNDVCGVSEQQLGPNHSNW